MTCEYEGTQASTRLAIEFLTVWMEQDRPAAAEHIGSVLDADGGPQRDFAIAVLLNLSHFLVIELAKEAKACVLVLIGVRADGSKELVTLKDGYRESGESWADLMRDCARRGMRVPVLAVGDGALDFWEALAEVFPETREQRCWVHKTANVLDAMPKSAEPGARKAIQDIYYAEDKQRAQAAIKTFTQLYGVKFAKAVKKITDDEAELLAFFDFPTEHWIHLRTTNPIESAFSTVLLRTKVTRGAGSRTAALAMVFELVESAQQRWRAVNAPHLVALVRAGARFERDQLVEYPEAVAA